MKRGAKETVLAGNVRKPLAAQLLTSEHSFGCARVTSPFALLT
jgi:hypothetical protein